MSTEQNGPAPAMRIYHGVCWDGDAPMVAMLVIAGTEASARQLMHDYEENAHPDDPRLDREIWKDPSLTRVALIGSAVPGLDTPGVLMTQAGAL